MNRILPTALALAALLLTATRPVPAQQASHLYSPADLAQQEGKGGDDYPFALPQVRYQQVHDDISTRAMIKAIAFRRDGGRTLAMAAWSVDLELHLATADRTADQMALTFALNRKSDFSQVIKRRWVNFPALPPAGSGPSPFVVNLPFDLAFPFRAQGGLLWEAVVYGNRQGSTTNQKVFAYLNAQIPVPVKGKSQAYGSGCKGSLGKVARSSSWIRNDGFLRSAISDLPAGAVGSMVYGISKSKFFIADLPFPLDHLGAPGCSLQCDHTVWLPFAADPFGQALVQATGARVNRDSQGLPIYCQPIIMDSKANAMGVTTGPGEELTMPAPLYPEKDISRLYSLEGSQAIKGTWNRGYGLVTRFEVK